MRVWDLNRRPGETSEQRDERVKILELIEAGKKEEVTSEMLQRALKEQGLTSSQIASRAADAAVKVLMGDDGTLMIAETEARVKAMESVLITAKDMLDDMRRKATSLDSEVSGLKEMIEAQKEHGGLTDERAKNTVSLYAQLIALGAAAKVSAEIAVTNAGYVTYAYLGGQAKREINGWGGVEEEGKTNQVLRAGRKPERY